MSDADEAMTVGADAADDLELESASEEEDGEDEVEGPQPDRHDESAVWVVERVCTCVYV